MSMTPEQLAEIKARADAATGPRLIYGHKSWAGENAVLTEEGHPVVVCGWGDQAKADAEFIAHARTDVPDLLAEVESLKVERWKDLAACADELDQAKAEVERLTKDRDIWRNQCRDANEQLAESQRAHLEWLDLLEVAAPESGQTATDGGDPEC